MISCKECPDKMQCVTENIKTCRRGFRLKRCCREYLGGRKRYILKLMLNMPEEMVKGNKIELNEVCGSCGETIRISLNINTGSEGMSFRDGLASNLDSFKIGARASTTYATTAHTHTALAVGSPLGKAVAPKKKKEDIAWDL